MTAIFQAIGVIRGNIEFHAIEGKKNKRATIKMGDDVYSLSGGLMKMRALEKQVSAHGSMQRLVVYPKVTHYPKPKDKPQTPHKISFQLVAYGNSPVLDELKDNEFKLSGIWQFIPVCKTPCISIMRNYTEDRKEFIKKSQPWVKVAFMKSIHLPLFWRDSIVPPFRFNPRLKPEDQGKAFFIQIKAKFLQSRGVFGFDSVLGMPTNEPPRFLKAKKEDKATVLKMKQQKKREQSKSA